MLWITREGGILIFPESNWWNNCYSMRYATRQAHITINCTCLTFLHRVLSDMLQDKHRADSSCFLSDNRATPLFLPTKSSCMSSCRLLLAWYISLLAWGIPNACHTTDLANSHFCLKIFTMEQNLSILITSRDVFLSCWLGHGDIININIFTPDGWIPM